MTIEKQFPSGAWVVSDIVNGRLERRTYYGYTKKEAQENFKQEMKELAQGEIQ
jgi:hypothetical protein